MSHTVVKGLQYAENGSNNSRNEVVLAANINTGRARQGHQEDNYLVCPSLNTPRWGQMRQDESETTFGTAIRTLEPEGMEHSERPKFGQIDRPFVTGERFEYGDRGCLMVVADGMGGMNAGEVASRLAVDGVREYFEGQINNIGVNKTPPDSLLKDCIISAHRKIMHYGQVNPSTAGMGTTVVIAWIMDQVLHVGWSGDSRCYLFRKNKLSQINKDHSYVQTLVDSRKISKSEAFDHPQKHIVTQSLGDMEHPPSPEYTYIPLLANDRILLCSDGLNTMLYDDNIEKLLNQNKDAVGAAQILVAETNKAGGFDNITVILADVASLAEKIAAPMPAAPVDKGAISSTPAAAKSFFSMSMLIMLAFLFLAIALGYMFFSGGWFGMKENVKVESNNGKPVATPPKPLTVTAPDPDPVPGTIPRDDPSGSIKSGNNPASQNKDEGPGFPLAEFLRDIDDVIKKYPKGSSCETSLSAIKAQMEKCPDVSNSKCAQALLCQADPSCGNIALLRKKYRCNTAIQGNLEFKSNAEKDAEEDVLAMVDRLYKRKQTKSIKKEEILYAGISIGATKTLASARIQKGIEAGNNDIRMKEIRLVYNPGSTWKYVLVLEAKNARAADELYEHYKGRGAQKVMYRRVKHGDEAWWQIANSQ